MPQHSFGPVLSEDGVTFRIWAPQQPEMRLLVEGREPLPMDVQKDGWHVRRVTDARAGQRYGFILGDGLKVPDPASRYQPEDVHGLSEIVDADTYRWRAADWRGRPWSESVIYEAHVGTFTEEGTFRAAIGKLDYLTGLGVTVLQLMPLSDFRGRRGWGYDGVLPYAPDSSYGRPEDLKELIDEAHLRGISVFLDVVYNHFGPDGNYLPNYAPFFTDKHHTPWGDGINFDDKGSEWVRTFMVENTLYWIEEFRIDGLRLDAVHAILDDSRRHILHEIAETVRERTRGRHVHLVVENEHNDSDLIARGADGSPRYFTAQWCDDIHHALHATATGEDSGYYTDYAGDAGKVARALAEGFLFQGEVMKYTGKPRGKPSGHLPTTAFISFIQNHDHVGNRLFGDRLGETVPPERMRALASIYLLAPHIPMLFMGEEWLATSRFPFFCDFDEELNAAVRKGRAKEFGYDPEDEGARAAPDPTAESTFAAAKLPWSESEAGEHAETLEHYRRLIALRREKVLPLLEQMGSRPAEYRSTGDVIEVRWFSGEQTLMLLANLGEESAEVELPANLQQIFPVSAPASSRLAPWDVVWLTG